MDDNAAARDRIDGELGTHLARAFGFEDPPETFGTLWTEMTETFADALEREVTLDDLCATDESPHRATVSGETRSYRCVTDAFLLGSALDEPVAVRTESPVSGAEIHVAFAADGAVDAPDGAWLSLGVERSVTAPTGPVTPEAMYGRLCPYSRAFASRAEYERWDAARPGVVSDASPLGDALERQAHVLGSTLGSDGPSRQTTAGDCACCHDGP